METPKWVVPAVAAGAGVVTGFAVGYIIGKRKATSEPIVERVHLIKNIDPKEVSIVKDNPWPNTEPPKVVNKEPENPVVVEKVIIDAEAFSAQIEAQKKLRDDVDELKTDILKREIEAIREKDREILGRDLDVKNVFTMEVEDEWDYVAEMENRRPDEPYVIHKDEYMENELEYQQETLTYYEGDEIMADQTDSPLWGWFDMMGPLKWGYGSEDPNVVYIRSEVLHMEWEVLRHTGRFEVEVGGLTIEDDYEKRDLKHSNTPRKFREF